MVQKLLDICKKTHHLHQVILRNTEITYKFEIHLNKYNN